MVAGHCERRQKVTESVVLPPGNSWRVAMLQGAHLHGVDHVIHQPAGVLANLLRLVGERAAHLVGRPTRRLLPRRAVRVVGSDPHAASALAGTQQRLQDIARPPVVVHGLGVGSGVGVNAHHAGPAPIAARIEASPVTLLASRQLVRAAAAEMRRDHRQLAVICRAPERRAQRALVALGVVKHKKVQLHQLQGIATPEDSHAVVVRVRAVLEPELAAVGVPLGHERHARAPQVLEEGRGVALALVALHGAVHGDVHLPLLRARVPHLPELALQLLHMVHLLQRHDVRLCDEHVELEHGEAQPPVHHRRQVPLRAARGEALLERAEVLRPAGARHRQLARHLVERGRAVRGVGVVVREKHVPHQKAVEGEPVGQDVPLEHAYRAGGAASWRDVRDLAQRRLHSHLQTNTSPPT
eukprot:1189472-Prorocentrum_minimum.AAC.2